MKSRLLRTLHSLPAYTKVTILLRSSGGAHIDSMAAIEGYVTACAYMESISMWELKLVKRLID